MEHLSVNKLLEGLPPGGINEENELTFTKVLAKFKGGERFTAALEGLVLGHMRDAFFYARQCCHGRLADDEIYSLCYSALDRAARRHHHTRGRFFAYAKPYIRGAIYRKWRSMDAVKGGGRTESIDEGDPNAGEVELEPIDNTDSVAEPEFDRMALHERMELVKPLLKKLSSSEKRVIELCYNGGLNFREVADLMGVTRSAIQGTHARALRKIRNFLLSMHRLYE